MGVQNDYQQNEAGSLALSLRRGELQGLCDVLNPVTYLHDVRRDIVMMCFVYFLIFMSHDLCINTEVPLSASVKSSIWKENGRILRPLNF